jgi:hypothetical protein
MLILLNLTAFSQTSSTDSIKCFTIQEAKTLLKFAEKGYLCDSLTEKYDKAIQDFENILIEKNDQLEISEKYIYSLTNEIEKERKKKKVLIASVGVLGVLCIVLGVK